MTPKDIKLKIKRIKNTFQKQPLTKVQKITRITYEMERFYTRSDISNNSDLLFARLNHVSRQFNEDNNILHEIQIGLSTSLCTMLLQLLINACFSFNTLDFVGIVFLVISATATATFLLLGLIYWIKVSSQDEETRIIYQNELNILRRIIDKQLEKQMKKIKKAK